MHVCVLLRVCMRLPPITTVVATVSRVAVATMSKIATKVVEASFGSKGVFTKVAA